MPFRPRWCTLPGVSLGEWEEGEIPGVELSQRDLRLAERLALEGGLVAPDPLHVIEELEEHDPREHRQTVDTPSAPHPGAATSSPAAASFFARRATSGSPIKLHRAALQARSRPHAAVLGHRRCSRSRSDCLALRSAAL